MGKTYRKIMRLKKQSFIKELVEGDDVQLKKQRFWIVNKNLKPYTKNGVQGKYTPENIGCTNRRNNTQHHKDEVRNANRSLKKGKRQELKKELRNELDSLGY